MTPLSLDDINKSSAYLVTATTKGYRFITDADVIIEVEFVYEDMLLPGEEVYQLVISNANHKTSPRDSKVRVTILSILNQFFSVNNTVLLYICETGDGKQSQRNRLFEYWFSTFRWQADFTFYTTTVRDADRVLNYAALIIRNDNPRLNIVVDKFMETARLLNNKPEL